MPLNIKNTYMEMLPSKFYSRIEISSVKKPELIIFNERLAKELGLDENEIEVMKKEGSMIFSGNRLMKNSIPIAQAYAGHQFGYFTMLGDGRTVLLGEQRGTDGHVYDIQLKGSGRTPYSRRGDGKAVLGPMLREYIISEAMSCLGIPTTRSLAVVKTGEPVYRETEKAGAVLTRTARSHIRVGTFEYASAFGSYEDLRKLTDYTIERHFPYMIDAERDTGKRYMMLIKKVINLQAGLIAKWNLAGFIHGVMNTDNMSISGETIDYGPCAFMDTYHPDTVFSSIDVQGRYSYGNQPYIGLWNLTVFAESLYPLFGYIYNNKTDKDIDSREEKEIIQHELLEYNMLYREFWLSGMRGKLGLSGEREGDEKLFKGLLEIMKIYGADYTNTFKALTINVFDMEDRVNGRLYRSQEFKNWEKRWKDRMSQENKTAGEIRKLMEKSNPCVIPRNHIVEEVIYEAENGNYAPLKEFMEILSEPYNYGRELSKNYTEPRIAKIPYQTYCGT